MPEIVTWVLSHLPQLIVAFVLLQVVRAARRAARLAQEHREKTGENDEERRVREIRERLRKISAERRGGGAASMAPPRPEPTAAPPVLRPRGTPPLEPFGGPSTRRAVIETMRRAIEPQQPPAIDPAALERQQKLAEQIRALDEARVLAERRAAQVAAQRDATVLTSASVTGAARANWLADLRDPHALRKAFVLREVLGPPVALR